MCFCYVLQCYSACSASQLPLLPWQRRRMAVGRCGLISACTIVSGGATLPRRTTSTRKLDDPGLRTINMSHAPPWSTAIIATSWPRSTSQTTSTRASPRRRIEEPHYLVLAPACRAIKLVGRRQMRSRNVRDPIHDWDVDKQKQERRESHEAANGPYQYHGFKVAHLTKNCTTLWGKFEARWAEDKGREGPSNRKPSRKEIPDHDKFLDYIWRGNVDFQWPLMKIGGSRSWPSEKSTPRLPLHPSTYVGPRGWLPSTGMSTQSRHRGWPIPSGG